MDCDQVSMIDGDISLVVGYAKEFEKPSRLMERPSLLGALIYLLDNIDDILVLYVMVEEEFHPFPHQYMAACPW
ncbi:hypothetical protein L6452_25268 [Arctium lappa]|uniref:Uncharacterized protein n=1 Tax=Arctium lappa TaxID=4217 RepID=A0ACB9AB45_ARCLA|nr:hypothetical protein L6452_25268 [Arctium lappa]